MIKVAVTGNIGSGKTEFIKFISKLGFSYISSDAIISKLYKDDCTRKIILEKLKLDDHNYKKEIIKMLQNEEFNKKLKRTIYPLLYAKKKIIAQKHQSYQPVFYEIPLLYEEKLFNNFNVTVFVNSDTIKRKQRVLKRGVTQDYFKLMNNKQIKENIKKNKSTFTVNNNGSILNLRLNIIKLLNKL
jgi:Dephospho-CoA kinase